MGNTNTSYAKLSNGAWGIRTPGVAHPGQTVTVTKKDGTRKVEKIDRVVWTGNGVSLCSIAQNGDLVPSTSTATDCQGRSLAGAPITRDLGVRYGRGTRTGCSCGSVEEYTKNSDCRSCKYDAE